jgi:hypothetical protein
MWGREGKIWIVTLPCGYVNAGFGIGTPLVGHVRMSSSDVYFVFSLRFRCFGVRGKLECGLNIGTLSSSNLCFS